MAEGCGCDWHPQRRRAWPHCRRCGTTDGAPYGFSWRGLCLDCSISGRTNAMISMANQRGAYWERYVASLARFAEAASAEIAGS